ncbi:MAG: hypothetical protein DMG30_26365 [Acidobacteria bacterium]|nr:MAG: hypothetical protein DMG30_26365 [Acidobacteriota bacterium]
MPGGVPWNPSKEPFSYAKLCFYYLPGLLVFLAIAALLISAFGELRWLHQMGNWFPSSVLLRVAIGAALIGAYYLFFMKVLWRLLPASIRTRIPYDAKEASESKGDIKSFWDLRKLVLRTRN